MSDPLISVIIPNHNSGPLLKRCLHSLRQQITEEAFEVIVVDDGSTDGSPDCVGSFPGISLIKGAHRGASSARNQGLKAARGQFIFFLIQTALPGRTGSPKLQRRC